MDVHEMESLKKLVEESKVIVLDIEGTITAFDFVKNELFPYAESHLEDFIMQYWKEEEVQDAFIILKKEAILDSKRDGFVPILNCSDCENPEIREKYLTSIIDNLKWQMANDHKTTGLKKIQGLIWKIGYENSSITGHLYEDVIDALEHWKSQGKDIYIYSSGSRKAQLYLFKYSKFGDISKYFREYFDTTIGSKLEPESYTHICNYAGRKPEEVLFFTDRPKEIVAARKCGLNTILVIRDPDHPLIKEEKEFLGSENGRISSFNFLK